MNRSSYSGWTPNPDIIVEDYRESKVLDQNGRPFLLERPIKIGFELKRKPDGVH